MNLYSSNFERAKQFMEEFRNLEYFNHCLEVLLHLALEEELDHKNGILVKAVDFICSYPSYLSVVVNCARKNEVSTWNTLFDVVGQPRTLFMVGFNYSPKSIANVGKYRNALK